MSMVIGDRIAVFVGPTAYGVDAGAGFLHDQRITLFPPVRRVDLTQLPPDFGTVVIVDGAFQTVPAVGHIEIRNLLADRVVYGCSSMGAIRAYEMRHMGMRGFGRVYQMFFEFDDFTDDEVAQLHGPEPSYLPVSEPLVNIRCYLEELVRDGVVSQDASSAIVDDIRTRYFGDRTLKLFGALLAQHVAEVDVPALVSGLATHRVKTRDFVQLMTMLRDQ